MLIQKEMITDHQDLVLVDREEEVLPPKWQKCKICVFVGFGLLALEIGCCFVCVCMCVYVCVRVCVQLKNFQPTLYYEKM